VVLPGGQLQAGETDALMQTLIDKWFYGMDVPSLGVQVLANGGVYQSAQGSLFAQDAPCFTDVAQGAIGDCYFMSALGETALRTPQTIESMFIDNGDGTFTVRFYRYDSATKQTTADYVTVNLVLPVYAKDGTFVYANHGLLGSNGQPLTYSNPSNVLWVALAEKAYAQLAEEGWSRPSKLNSYDALSDGSGGTALLNITGVTDGVSLSISSPNAEQQILNALFSGEMITMSTYSSLPPHSPVDTGHVLMLVGYDVVNQLFLIVNPYDDYAQNHQHGPRFVALTWAQVAEYFDHCSLVPTPATAE
jgi:hypothetical protein